MTIKTDEFGSYDDSNWVKYAQNRKRLRKAITELDLALNEQSKICNGSIFSNQISQSQKANFKRCNN